MPSKAAIYLRYSTHNQRETSIDIQRAAIDFYCQVSGLTVVAEFADRGYSGTTCERPAFGDMLKLAAENPDWSVILVYDYSRFSRESDAIKYIRYLERYGISVVSVKDSYEDYLNATFERNENYVKEVSSATRAGLAIRAREGKSCGGKPPYGYDVASTGELTVNEAEAKVVRQIFELFTTGFSYNEIFDKLKQSGVKNRKGNYFNKRAFIGMLKQRKYIGEFTWSTKDADNREEFIQSTCPVIVDKGIFDKAQEMLSNRAGGRAIKSSKSRTLFSGTDRIICGICGTALTVKQRSVKGKKGYCAYKCPCHDKRSCTLKEVRTRDIDMFAALCIYRLIFKKNLIENCINTDEHELKKIRTAIVKYLLVPTNTHVRAIIDTLDVRVTVGADDINVSMMCEST